MKVTVTSAPQPHIHMRTEDMGMILDLTLGAEGLRVETSSEIFYLTEVQARCLAHILPSFIRQWEEETEQEVEV